MREFTLFIRILCDKLGLPCWTCGHSLLYFAEFVDFQRRERQKVSSSMAEPSISEDISSSMAEPTISEDRGDPVHEIDLHLVAMACVFIASKTTESLCKLRALVTVSYLLLNPGKSDFDIGPDYWMLRDSVMTCELLIARVIAFDFPVELPYPYLVTGLDRVLDSKVKSLFPHIDEFYSFQWDIAENAVALINDSLLNVDVILNYTAREIAASSLYKALKIPECRRITLLSFCERMGVKSEIIQRLLL